MPSKNKPTALNESSLTSSLSSIVRKQNVLAAIPPALRVLPLAAFAAGDLYERKYGKDPLESLLGPTEMVVIESQSSSDAIRSGSSDLISSQGHASHASTISASCGVCLRSSLGSFSTKSYPVDALELWHGKGYGMPWAYGGWQLHSVASSRTGVGNEE
jgi:hypothetical protein